LKSEALFDVFDLDSIGVQTHNSLSPIYTTSFLLIMDNF